MERPSWDEYFMTIARDVSTRTTCLRRACGAVIVKDRQMLATGGSAAAAVQFLRDKGAENIKLIVLIAAPEGLREVLDTCGDDIDIYVGAIDDHLNDHGYIVPGLGDAGDRLFGTL